MNAQLADLQHMPRPLLLLCVLAIELSLTVSTTSATSRWLPAFFGVEPPPPAQIIFGEAMDLVVATVVQVDDAYSTKGNPPFVTLRVEESLLGVLAPGDIEARWTPYPLWMPCPVGEGATIRAWKASTMRGPKPGERMIVAGRWSDDGFVWKCDPLYRWAYSDSLRNRWRDRVREVSTSDMEKIAERGRAHIDGLSERRPGALQAESTRVATEAMWVENERRVIREAPIEQLVAESEVVLLGDVVAGEDYGYFRSSCGADYSIRERLFVAPGMSTPNEQVACLYFGRHESDLIRRWNKTPPDLRPGIRAGAPARGIAFLKRVYPGNPASERRATYRPVHPVYGVLLDDRGVMARTLGAIERQVNRPRQPRSECNGTLRDLVSAARPVWETVQVKFCALSRTGRLHAMHNPLVIGANAEQLSTGSFVPCAVPDSFYVRDLMSPEGGIVMPTSALEQILEGAVRLQSTWTAQGSESMVSFSIRYEREGRIRFAEHLLDLASSEVFLGRIVQIAAEHGARADVIQQYLWLLPHALHGSPAR